MKNSLQSNREALLYASLEKMRPFFTEKHFLILMDFYENYKKALQENIKKAEKHIELFETLVKLLIDLQKHPYHFPSYHQKIRSPFDYYRFGKDFLRPMIHFEKSHVLGSEHLALITSYLAHKENVVLFANHQSESDPQAMTLLLEKIGYENLAEKIIYVAGERVITDPLAVPFSMGCDLICIYSKKYIHVIPEKREEKQLHNTKTMHQMSLLLKEGGKIIYVAPSGGRDRPNAEGTVEIAPFDPESIEMFYLMARRSKTKTHFFPLALSTYNLLPPPKERQNEMGEKRMIRFAPIHMAFGNEIAMEPFDTILDKEQKRKLRAEAFYTQVQKEYAKIQGDFL